MTGDERLWLQAALQGFGLGFSLILAIGAQNALILRHGLAKSFVWPLCLICSLSDSVLIIAGVWGAGSLLETYANLRPILVLIAIAWLVGYAFLRIRDALMMVKSDQPNQTVPTMRLGPALRLCLLLTWANPHVYLDTVVLLGGLSTIWPGDARWLFGFGACLASFVFFFGLGYGAGFAAPLMQRPRAWFWFDLVTGLVMLAIASLLAIKLGGQYRV
ncbi:MAG: LysE family transporter [Pseudomonadota bacterium]